MRLKARLLWMVFWFVVAAAVVALLVVRSTTVAAPAHPLSGTFEGQGVVTLGCSLWSKPDLQPYGADNPNTGTIIAQLGGDRDHGYDAVFIVDGPDGTYEITGHMCGASIDWSTLPQAGGDSAGNTQNLR